MIAAAPERQRPAPQGHETPRSQRAPRPQGVVEIKIFGAHDDEKATAMLRAIYGSDVVVKHLGGDQALNVHTIAAAFGDARLIRSKLSGWSLTRSLEDQALIVFPIEGQMTFSSGNRNFVVLPNKQAAIGWPFEKINLQVAHGEIIALYAPIDALYERAARLGCRSSEKLPNPGTAELLDLTQPVADSLARAMKSAIVDAAYLDTVNLSNLVADGFEDLLLGMATAALFPCVLDCLGHAPPDCGIPALRRARDYIEAHAFEGVKLSRLAKTLGISMRAMQVGFKRCFGCSPRDFIIECRLEKTRKMLLEANRAASITQIALDCGFGDLSHFSARYRDRYGELPSETMRSAARR